MESESRHEHPLSILSLSLSALTHTALSFFLFFLFGQKSIPEHRLAYAEAAAARLLLRSNAPGSAVPMSTAVSHQMRYHHPSAALSTGVQGLRDKQYEKEEGEEKKQQKERKTVPATGMMMTTMGYGWPYAAQMQQQHQQQYQQYLFMQQQQQLQAMMATTTGGSAQTHSHHLSYAGPNPHHLAK